MQSRFLAAIIAFSLFLPGPSAAQSYSNTNNAGNPPVYTIGPSQGGAIGMSFDTNLYRCGSYTCLRVIGMDRTNFSAVRVGDYVYLVNNISFHSVDSFFGLIRENAPGTVVRIDYWDAANGRSMYQSAAVRAGSSSSNSLASLNSMLPQLEEIVRTDARHWDISTYRAGSLRDLYVASVSSDRRTYVIRGTYNYGGFWSSNYQDWVNFRFSGSDLSCIEFGHERGCRSLLTQDRQRLAAALVVVGAVAVAAVASGSGGSSGSGTGGGYRGQTRYQCEQTCNRYPGDPNPNVEAAVIAQCRRRCSSLPSY